MSANLPETPAPLQQALDACRHRDPEGFHRLRQAVAPAMLATALHFVQDVRQAEDVVHDTLLLAWLNAERFAADDLPPGSWLFTILGSRLHSQLEALAGRPPSAPRAVPTGLQGQALWTLARDLESRPPSASLGDRLTESLSARLAAPQLPKTPTGELVHPPLYDARLRRKMLTSRLAYQAKEGFKRRLGRPLEEWAFRRWLAQRPVGQWLEAQGLPRRSVEAALGDRLDLEVNPGRLVRCMSYPDAFPDRTERRKASNLFLWSGDWDLPHHSLADSSRTRFIQDLWTHRLEPSRSETFRRLEQQREQGRPLRSHHKGMLLDSRERILEYLRLYLLYMENMACFGFDKHEGKDRLGVTIDRHGRIIKTNKGLHRLAMAQVLGLAEITVRVRSVHRQWWQRHAGDAKGRDALERVAQALPECVPA
ncbi:sigma factor [Halomonas sp. M4R5S39]|uniref:RNA polymerase sigma factor n=1 Tax=Halomonas kalidii TaxID=3043293 RepID=UPI0024A7DA7A|nr:sigma factor [Halomonas kalidii]MDI5983538.1 sigma factor [Halomonas kalidii]